MLGLGVWGPLIVAVSAQLMAVWMLGGVVWRWIAPEIGSVRWAPIAMAVLLPLAINGLALPLTGMEHSLHVLASVTILWGLVHMTQTGRVPGLLVLAVVACCLIRFEGFALSLLAVAAVLVAGHWRAALSMATLISVAVITYGMLMHRLGLPVLPSSVLVKSVATAGAVDGSVWATLRGTLAGVMDSMREPRGVMFLAGGLFGLWAVLRDRVAVQARLATLAGSGALLAHVVFGQYEWFGRYEPYGAAILIVVIALSLSGNVKQGSRPKTTALLWCVGLVAITGDFAMRTFETPGAARNIFQQQFQMHRFATDYFPYSVAVNDLGYVSYDNDQYVLDLWGLGSEEARRVTQAQGRTPASLTLLTAGRGITFAMVYDAWFASAIPGSWCKMGVLTTSKVSTAEAEVGFYLIDRSREAEMMRALDAYLPTLPAGATFARQDCAG
jgi:hypothetical protein